MQKGGLLGEILPTWILRSWVEIVQTLRPNAFMQAARS